MGFVTHTVKTKPNPMFKWLKEDNYISELSWQMMILNTLQSLSGPPTKCCLTIFPNFIMIKPFHKELGQMAVDDYGMSIKTQTLSQIHFTNSTSSIISCEPDYSRGYHPLFVGVYMPTGQDGKPRSNDIPFIEDHFDKWDGQLSYFSSLTSVFLFS